ncbi:hypothetical protein O181_018616 [Austropuccinia psidii MF-1]|uniref:Uncharacterized protein n=1 Tax=Austropuccinia psidii MF-1 TaxID=1389203 RepID=A0A9Q3GT40_9BASI|nr:hypothetical protein [Austropuccinia psidii MF-1]
MVNPERWLADQLGLLKYWSLVTEFVLEPKPTLRERCRKKSHGIRSIIGATGQAGDETMIEQDRKQTEMEMACRNRCLTNPPSRRVLEMGTEAMRKTRLDDPGIEQSHWKQPSCWLGLRFGSDDGLGAGISPPGVWAAPAAMEENSDCKALAQSSWLLLPATKAAQLRRSFEDD